MPNLLECGLIGGRAFFDLGEYAARYCLADLRNLRIVLEHFSGNIERHVLGIDDAAHKPQIGREEVGVVADEDAPNIEPMPSTTLGVIKIEGFLAGHKQKDPIFVTAFRLVVDGERRVRIDPGDVAEELLVLLRRDIRLRPHPDRIGGVDLADGVRSNAQ